MGSQEITMMNSRSGSQYTRIFEIREELGSKLVDELRDITEEVYTISGNPDKDRSDVRTLRDSTSSFEAQRRLDSYQATAKRTEAGEIWVIA